MWYIIPPKLRKRDGGASSRSLSQPETQATPAPSATEVPERGRLFITPASKRPRTEEP
ncbi:hypothetical protein L484_004169 [Morus notabilis]|uniref:Uncharacterized protein n=1 Tax=Morus notabilis TaxID=981085 RepID=W9QC28_9ROSA|nr:hypothetical protein L484_004169 [Morus notabilis]